MDTPVLNLDEIITPLIQSLEQWHRSSENRQREREATVEGEGKKEVDEKLRSPERRRPHRP